MTVVFLLAVALTSWTMKLAAALKPVQTRNTRWLFLLSPLISPTSIRRVQPRTGTPRLFWRAVRGSIGLILFYLAYGAIHSRWDLPLLARGYLAVPAVYLLGQTGADWLRLIWSCTGGLIPAMHHAPFLATGIADFWSRRWNVWFSDWFRFVIFGPLRRRPPIALFAVFGFSGLMHEGAINLPFYMVTGRNLFGSMTAYFLLQAMGVLLERRISRRYARSRRLLGWVVIFVPAPLIVNEGMIRALQFW